MNKQERIMGNAISSIFQVLITGATLFCLYRYLLDTIGVEKLGIWSLVLATTSISQISNLGLVDCVVKYVAKYVALEDQESISKLIQTILITVGVMLGIVLLILNIFSENILVLFIDSSQLSDALSIFPIALTSAWVMTIGWINLGGLDGHHRIDLRNYIIIGNNIIYVVLSILLVKPYGLMGLARAQLIGGCILLVISYLLLRKQAPLPILPRVWDRKFFKEILVYGLNFQVISITKVLYDPITKGLIALFGGLAMVGYYEMASRMVQQFRGLIVAANQVLIPTIADLNEKEPTKIKKLYLDSLDLAFFVTIPIFSFIASLIPCISEIWIGKYEAIFVKISLLLLVGWFLNILSAPAYFAYIGIGRLKWNVISHLVIAILSITLSSILGLYFDGLGVVIGFINALVLGSFITIIAYHREEKISWRVLWTINNKVIFIASLLNILISQFIYSCYLINTPVVIKVLVLMILFCFVMIIPILKHPMGNRMQRWIFKLLIQSDRRL